MDHIRMDKFLRPQLGLSFSSKTFSHLSQVYRHSGLFNESNTTIYSSSVAMYSSRSMVCMNSGRFLTVTFGFLNVSSMCLAYNFRTPTIRVVIFFLPPFCSTPHLFSTVFSVSPFFPYLSSSSIHSLFAVPQFDF